MQKNSFNRKLLLLIIFLLALLPAVSSQSQEEATKYIIAEPSYLRVHGTSTLNNFTIHAEAMKAELRLPDAGRDSLSFQAISSDPRGAVTVPVQELHGGNALFNRDLHHALEAKKYPEVIYQLTAFRPGDNLVTEPDWRLIQTKGRLTITDLTRTIRMEILGRWSQPDRIEFKGNKILTISEFGVTPPTRFFGALRVSDTVTVDFYLHLQPEGEE